MSEIKVLLLENDPDISDVIEIILTIEKFEVTTTSIDRIFNDIIHQQPDLILLDQRVHLDTAPTSLCRQIHENVYSKNLPIILMSTSSKLEQFANECGATAYIEKPFDIVDLCNTVKEILSLKL